MNKRIRLIGITILTTAFMMVSGITFCDTSHAGTQIGAMGECGDDVDWYLDFETGTLTISGEGRMYDYYTSGPQYDYYRDKIKNIVIEDGVTSVGAKAFQYYNVDGTLKISSSVISIGDYAFNGCNQLTGEIDFSKFCVGMYSFAGCSKLTGQIAVWNGETRVPDYAFSGCAGLTGDLVIPNTVEAIGEGAFGGIGSEGKLVIPKSVTFISRSAFSNCSFTGKLLIPDSVKTIDMFAFSGCSGFTGDLAIPGSIEKIGAYAFKNCTGFSKLLLPDSMKELPTGAFSGCSGLSGNLTIPSSLNTIPSEGFEGCSGFTGELIIPDSVTSIGSKAFKGCSGLTGELVMPDTIYRISVSTFEGCSGFSGPLVLPEKMEILDSRAFYGCTGLNGTVIAPESAQRIGADAFGEFENKNAYVFKNTYADTYFNDNGWNVSYLDEEGAEAAIIQLPDSNLYNINVGEKKKLKYYLYPSDKFDKSSIVYSSDNEKIVSIDKSGLMTAKEKGTVNITISCGDISKAIKITVKKPITSIDFASEEVKVPVGETRSTELTITPSDTTDDKTVAWTSADESIATVDQNGNVTAVTEGNTNIFAKVGSHTATCKATCVKPVHVEAISLSETDIEIEYGKTFKLDVLYEPEDTTDIKRVEWETSDTGIATVSDGTVSGEEIGEAVITAKFGDITADCNVSVIRATPSADIPTEVKSYCNWELRLASLPAGFKWKNPDESVGLAGKKTFEAVYSPTDKIHYHDVDVEIPVKVLHLVAGENVYEYQKASFTSDGKAILRCLLCENPAKTYVIPKAKVRLSKTAFTYNGTVQTPSVYGENVVAGTDFASTWSSGRKNVGTYYATVILKGNAYAGTKKLTYVINPKGTTQKTPKKAKKAFTAKWTKQKTKMSAARITGYQIQYSMSSGFKSGNKTVNVKGYKKTSKKIKKLKAKKKYYVRVRTYMNAGGKIYYSGWSATKAVTTK